MSLATVTAIRCADAPKVTKTPMELRVYLPGGRSLSVHGYIEGDPKRIEDAIHKALRENGFTHTCIYPESVGMREPV